MKQRIADLWEYQSAPLFHVGRWVWVELKRDHGYTRFAWGVCYQNYPGKWYAHAYLGAWYLQLEVWKPRRWGGP